LAQVLEKRGNDVLEDISFSKDHATGANIKGVARVGVEVVVDLYKSVNWIGRVVEVLHTAWRRVFDWIFGERPLVWWI
jgi:hypothetical protein